MLTFVEHLLWVRHRSKHLVHFVTLFNSLSIWFHPVVPSTAPSGRYQSHLHFTGEETEAQSNFTQVHAVSGEARIRTGNSTSEPVPALGQDTTLLISHLLLPEGHAPWRALRYGGGAASQRTSNLKSA